MKLGEGSTEVVIGLLDGPVATDHRDLAGTSIRQISKAMGSKCSQVSSAACRHGTFVAGILSARRGSAAPAICPGCTLLVCPIFQETNRDGMMPSETPEEVARAIIEAVGAGARVLNLSAAFDQPSTRSERHLKEALDHAARRGTIVVAAAGNQGTLGSSAITRHPWVIPVGACDPQGRPLGESNLGGSIGKRGLMAPGEGVTSLGAEGKPLTWGGTSVAAPFVTGTIALLWSEFPDASATELKSAVMASGYGKRRTSVVPPLLDARAAYEAIGRKL